VSERYAQVGDNAGRCESCNRPETEYQTQTAYPVKLGAGWGFGSTCMGTMWLCPRCLKEHQERDAAPAESGEGA
jgi:hypothetical protein